MQRLSWMLFICIMCAACSVNLELSSAPETNTTAPLPLPDLSDAETATVRNVIDGDTVDVIMDGTEYRVRYVGVNTPERDEACYTEARNANRTLVAGQQIQMLRDVSDTDQYGRLLRYIFVDDHFVNAELIAEGWGEAVEYNDDRRFTADFRRLEAQARDANLGCHPTGIFDDGSDRR